MACTVIPIHAPALKYQVETRLEPEPRFEFWSTLITMLAGMLIGGAIAVVYVLPMLVAGAVPR